MTPEEKLGLAAPALDNLVTALQGDMAADAEFTVDHLVAMVAEMRRDLDEDWIEAVLWITAIAVARLAGVQGLNSATQPQ